MLVTLVGLAIVVVASIYIAWPLLGRVDESVAVEHSEATALVREKEAALDAIGEIDFDHRVGKMSDEDHAALRADLEQRALHALAAMEEAEAPIEGDAAPVAAATTAGAGGPGGFCASCGSPYRSGARFCTGCGEGLRKSKASDRRRRARS